MRSIDETAGWIDRRGSVGELPVGRRGFSWFAALEAKAEQLARIGFVLSMCFFASAGLYGLWLANKSNGNIASLAAVADAAASDAGFRISEIGIEGVRNTPAAVLNAAMQVNPSQSIFSYDTDAARERLLRLGWIETAEVRRVLPSTLEVAVVERKPFARYEMESGIVVVDRSGRMLGEDVETKFGHLFLVSGPGSALAAPELIDELLLARTAGAKVAQAELVAGRFWKIKLTGGLIVKLPRKVPALSLQRLETLITNGKLEGMNLETIDLRLPHRTVLQLQSATVHNRDSAVALLTAKTNDVSLPGEQAGKSRL